MHGGIAAAVLDVTTPAWPSSQEGMASLIGLLSF